MSIILGIIVILIVVNLVGKTFEWVYFNLGRGRGQPKIESPQMPDYSHLGALFAIRHRYVKEIEEMKRLIKQEEERRATEAERRRQDKIIAEIKREEELAKYKEKYPNRF